MADEHILGKETTRREAMKAALKVGAYAAPVVLAISTPDTVSAQVSPAVATLTGTIRNEANGLPISGATVTVAASLSAVTNASGVYTISPAPAGLQSVRVSASGFTTLNTTVTIAASGITTFSAVLNPAPTD